MPNVKSIIDNNNKKSLKLDEETTPQRLCNCRKPADCPMSGKCLMKEIIYQCTVSCNGKEETYIGLTENTFKQRYANHKASFKNKNLSNATELSKHIWHLKDSKQTYNIKWNIIRQAKAYRSKQKCHLCLWEKFYIIFKPEMASLNKRSEFMSTCRHAAKFLICNI